MRQQLKEFLVSRRVCIYIAIVAIDLLEAISSIKACPLTPGGYYILTEALVVGELLRDKSTGDKFQTMPEKNADSERGIHHAYYDAHHFSILSPSN